MSPKDPGSFHQRMLKERLHDPDGSLAGGDSASAGCREFDPAMALA